MRRAGPDWIVLSRRNLEALLAKLDGHPPHSVCTLVGDRCTVTAEENDVHYKDRPEPGPMHEETEAVL